MKTFAEIQAAKEEILRVEREFLAARNSDLAEVIKLIKKQDYTIAEIQAALEKDLAKKPKGKKEKAPAKYILKGVKWNAQGRMPNTYKEYLAIPGHTLDDLLIEKQGG